MTNDKSSSPSFDDLRQNIDAIDREIHALLMRRADVVMALGALKKTDGGASAPLALRPGREAVILRKLAETHKGPFPLPALLGIWRSMISAYLHMQTPFNVLVPQQDQGISFGAGSLWDLARSHFGAAIPIHTAASPRAIVTALAHDPTLLGVLPRPTLDDWWTTLPLGHADRPHIVAALPAWSSDGPHAYLLSRTPPEPMGADVALILVRGTEMDSSVILQAAHRAGLDDASISAYKAGIDGHASHLIATRRLDAVAGAEGPLAAAVRGEAGLAGLFAEPLAL
ncbi:chorismate mutase [Govanella unica]|uniref:chorismate mutase n=1 Tax=Govanella unica TaxID=2975056 RepID=A0A9X3TW26_9PROT|nr:chorismate mutase [Govania unica]MDA5192609.1 chorismate mutase [Govania unica]